MPRMSSSVSVGRPVRKYSLTRRHPWEKADSTAPYRSSSRISLLITWRIRQVPASGANVSPVRRTFWISLAMPTVKASTRRLGRLTDTWLVHRRVIDDAGHHLVDAGEVGARQRREADLVVAGAAQAVADHLAHLARPAAPGPAG